MEVTDKLFIEIIVMALLNLPLGTTYLPSGDSCEISSDMKVWVVTDDFAATRRGTVAVVKPSTDDMAVSIIIIVAATTNATMPNREYVMVKCVSTTNHQNTKCGREEDFR